MNIIVLQRIVPPVLKDIFTTSCPKQSDVINGAVIINMMFSYLRLNMKMVTKVQGTSGSKQELTKACLLDLLLKYLTGYRDLICSFACEHHHPGNPTVDILIFQIHGILSTLSRLLWVAAEHLRTAKMYYQQKSGLLFNYQQLVEHSKQTMYGFDKYAEVFKMF